MMGIRLTKNFDRPYLSVSYTEFFRRWHISLGRWFMDYLYIPLGGNRKGTKRKIRNTFIVFALCGLWHGANWTYVCWGMYAAFFLCVESVMAEPFRIFCEKKQINLENAAVKNIRRVIQFLIFIPAALIFRSSSLGDMGIVLKGLFTDWGFGITYLQETLNDLNMTVKDIGCVLLSLLCMCQLHDLCEYKTGNDTGYAWRVSAYVYTLLTIVIGWLLLTAGGDSSAFAYFQF